MRTELNQWHVRLRQLMTKGTLGDSGAYKVATQDEINYCLRDVSADRFINMFIDLMMQTCSVFLESLHKFSICYNMPYTVLHHLCKRASR